MDDVDIIRDHYKQKYPHLRRVKTFRFKMDEAFLYDEDVDDDTSYTC